MAIPYSKTRAQRLSRLRSEIVTRPDLLGLIHDHLGWNEQEIGELLDGVFDADTREWRVIDAVMNGEEPDDEGDASARAIRQTNRLCVV